jgi:hypothetical protein
MTRQDPIGMGNRDTGRLGPRDTEWGPKPGTGAAHGPGTGHAAAGAPAAVGGGDAHRVQVTPARRRKRPVCAAPDGSEETGTQNGRPPSRHRGQLDRELLETLIVREWTKTLKGPYDWGDWPLARYTLDADFLAAVERHAGQSPSELAWVCAMIACGRASRLRSLDPQPLRSCTDGSQLVRSDGATGWHCNLKRNAADGPQLRYWVHPHGPIEFETVAEVLTTHERDDAVGR